MPVSLPYTKDDETTGLPLAYIDSIDDIFVIPIREYLQGHQCSVAYNSAEVRFAEYHIIVGDLIYVKNFIAFLPHHGKKTILIIWNCTKEELENIDDFKKIKVVLNPPDQLSSRDVSEIFSLFFTSGKSFLNFGKQRKEAPKNFERVQRESIKQESPYVNRDQPITEQGKQTTRADRVNQVIQDVFNTSEQNGKKESDTKRNPLKISTLKQNGISKYFVRTAYIFSKMLIFGLIFLVLWYLVLSGMGVLSISVVAKSLLRGDITTAKVAFNVGKFALQSNKAILSIVSSPMFLLNKETRARDQERLLSLLENILDSANNATTLFNTGKDLSRHFFEPSLGDRELTSPATVYDRLHNELYFVRTSLGLSSANLGIMLQKKEFPFSIPIVEKQAQAVARQLGDIRETLLTLDQLLTLYPSFSGFRKERTYLILFQNSSELRPTGGFIGSIGIASFVDGTLSSLEIKDVYDIDGQLKGHVDPPEPVARFLGNEHWYLRDSNWDPDFQASGARAAWFYEKITGKSVDGVIAVDSLFFVDLLRELGPIDLKDYNDRISEENFFGKSLYYSSGNFFPGSTQKKDFLGSLARALIEKITSGDTHVVPQVFHAVQEALRKKDLLIFVKDPDAGALVREYGWGGTMRYLSGCEIEAIQHIECSKDYLYVNEANMSVNKVNYFMKREATLAVTMGEDGKINEALEVVFNNFSIASAGGGGQYLLYFRLYIPDDGSIASVNLDGAVIPERLPEDSAKASPYYENLPSPRGLKSVGVVMSIESKSKKRLTISWSRERMIEFRDAMSVYEYFIEKQPGINDAQWTIDIRFPRGWNIVQEKEGSRENIKTVVGSSELVANENTLEYNRALDSDIRLKLYLAK